MTATNKPAQWESGFPKGADKLGMQTSRPAHRFANQQAVLLHIPDQIVHPFRFKSSSRSGGNRPLIPDEFVQPFRTKSSTPNDWAGTGEPE